MAKYTILIVEDDTTYGMMLKRWFDRNEFESVLTSKVEAAKDELERHSFQLILSDLRLPDGDGIQLLSWMREQKMMTPMILMTGYADVRSAVAAMKLGAEDYLEKPINPTLLREKIDKVLAAPIKEAPVVTTTPSAEHQLGGQRIIEGDSPASQKMYEHLRMVAPTQLTVLLLGESGTGKEHSARMVHQFSARCDRPFIAVDCGALSRDLAPSELFGHVKGAFTSAVDNKKGVFELANGGTIFLDEIGNLSYEVQVQLLRALQEHKVRPVGSAHDISVDVRLIAATNEDLTRAIEEGRFRADLYHRINEFSILIPPLRDRHGDLLLYARHFLEEANKELGRQVTGISSEAAQLLESHRWEGNLRELRNVMRRAVLFATTDLILPEYLGLTPSIKPMEVSEMALQPANEREQIEAALHRARGNKSLAARLLQIDRKTLYNKMHALGMDL